MKKWFLVVATTAWAVMIGFFLHHHFVKGEWLSYIVLSYIVILVMLVYLWRLTIKAFKKIQD